LQDGETAESQAAQVARERKERTKTQIGSRKRKLDPVQSKILKVLNEESELPNRHISFFNGIVPSLETFSDDEVPVFQQGVLSLIQNIKQNRNPRSFPREAPRDHFTPSYSRARSGELHPQGRSLEAIHYGHGN